MSEGTTATEASRPAPSPARRWLLATAAAGFAAAVGCAAAHLRLGDSGAVREAAVLRLDATLARQVLAAQSALDEFLSSGENDRLSTHRGAMRMIPETIREMKEAGRSLGVAGSVLDTGLGYLAASLADWKEHFADPAVKHKLARASSALSGLKRRKATLEHSREVAAALEFAHGHVEQTLAIHRSRLVTRRRWLAAGALAGLALFASAGLVRLRRDLDAEARLAHRSEHLKCLAAYLENAQYLTSVDQVAQLLTNTLREHAAQVMVVLREDGEDDLQVVGAAGTEPEPPPSPLDDASACPVMGTGQSLVVGNGTPLEHACPCPIAAARSGAFACLPLVAQSRVIGLVHIRPRPGKDLAGPDLDHAQALTRATSMIMSRMLAYKDAKHEAITDELTGVHNRRFLEGYLHKQVQMARRQSAPLAVLMLDLDMFKSFNDRHGHQAGDSLLVAFARALTECVREGDLVARYGGEEFTVVLPNTTTDTAREIAERIRQSAGGIRLPDLSALAPPIITVSIGVAVAPGSGNDSTTLIGAADASLYSAKQAGRNRVIVASSSLPDNLT